jgi:hypothetical protein
MAGSRLFPARRTSRWSCCRDQHLADELRQRGHDVREIGEGKRISPCTMTERLEHHAGVQLSRARGPEL